MVSEGVDIPRLRVGVYATAAKTPLVFRQIVGRFVRTLPGRPLEPSWLYVPADPVLRDHAADDRGRAAPRPGPARGRRRRLGVRRARAAARSERSEEPAFVPLERRRRAADVAVRAAAGPRGRPDARRARSPPRAPAMRRRRRAYRRSSAGAMLRSERHRLVSEVTRRDRTDHREVNAWLNRRLGIKSVEKATVEELERSVELLVGRLTRRR